MLCTGDLHRHEWAGYQPVDRLADQEAVLDQIVEVARERAVDALLLAGDIFHRPHPTPRVLDTFRRFCRRLGVQGIDTVAICGNASHDITNATDYAALELFDDLIDVRRVPGIWNGRGVAVACLPSVPVSTLVAARDGGDRDEVNQDAALLLVEAARELRAQIPDGTQAVLLAHWSVSGAAFPNGLPVDAAREPVLPLAELEQLGFDAVVLGHIHKPQPLGTLAPDDEVMPIFYTGSPLPLDFGETGFNHGVWLLDDAHGYMQTEFVPLDSRAFITLDYAAETIADDPMPAFPDGAIVRVRYAATEEQARRIDNAAIKRALVDAGAARVTVQPEIVRDDRARVQGLDEALSELEAVDLYVTSQQLDDAPAEKLRELTSTYLEVAA
jgi:exonuclease SbcD